MFNFYAKFSISTIILALLIIIFIALVFVLPVEYSYENHFLENLEVVILFLGFCLSVFNIVKHMYRMTAKFYLACSLIYLLMIGRELSWGRVFYLIGHRANGEEIYISIHNLWYGDFIYVLNTILIIIILACLAYFIYQTHKSGIKWNIPLWETIVFVVMAILSQCVFERELILCLQNYNQLLEESTETLAYISLVFGTYKTFFEKNYIRIKYFDMI